MLAVTLTFSVIISIMFLVIGGVVGYLLKEYVIERNSRYIPTHPEMFDESEDFSIPRRQYVEFKPDIPTFKRPKNDKFLCPPKIKLAQMKKSCVRCERIFDDHITNHHILHHVCHICSHMKRLSEISFKLTCHICFKKFKDKYSLAGHLQVHNDDNPNY